MITIRQKGDFKNTTNFLKNAKTSRYIHMLEKYGKRGVAALESATPRDTGTTATSWYYEIIQTDTQVSLVFKNSNTNQGIPIAILIQYGHGTRNGGYVEGIDYINPALKPIFEELADKAWKEVNK